MAVDLINVVPPMEMAKIKIIPLLSVDEADEFFYFVVDFYACQHCMFHFTHLSSFKKILSSNQYVTQINMRNSIILIM